MVAHFADAATTAASTRVMVFAQRRQAGLEIVRLLEAHDGVRPSHGLAPPRDRLGARPAAPRELDGRHFVDEHADGTRSVYFRVQLIDFDMSTGKVCERLERLRLRLH